MTISSDTLPEVVRADHIPGPAQGQWTYADYAALPEDGHHYEVIEGIIYMAPSPNEPHQAANLLFLLHLGTHIQLGGLGRVYGPPFDVELANNAVVQPDVIVILNAHRNRITHDGIVGAPDLVVEIASPGTANYDRRAKQDAYAVAGVAEYWIADPASQTIQVLTLEQGAYRSLGIYQGKATLPSKVVPNLPVRVEQFFS